MLFSVSVSDAECMLFCGPLKASQHGKRLYCLGVEHGPLRARALPKCLGLDLRSAQMMRRRSGVLRDDRARRPHSQSCLSLCSTHHTLCIGRAARHAQMPSLLCSANDMHTKQAGCRTLFRPAVGERYGDAVLSSIRTTIDEVCARDKERKEGQVVRRPSVDIPLGPRRTQSLLYDDLCSSKLLFVGSVTILPPLSSLDKPCLIMGIPVRPTVDPGRTGAMLSVDSQLLRSVRLRARKSGHRHLVRLASTTASPLRSIAVLGAGLAGLSHALFLARGLRQDDNGKKHRIVVYDAAERTGGWVQSERQPLPRSSQEIEAGVPQETALLEAGPRSVRAAGLGGVSMIELVRAVARPSKGL